MLTYLHSQLFQLNHPPFIECHSTIYTLCRAQGLIRNKLSKRKCIKIFHWMATWVNEKSNLEHRFQTAMQTSWMNGYITISRPTRKGNEVLARHSLSSSGQPKVPSSGNNPWLPLTILYAVLPLLSIAYYDSLSSSATLLAVSQERDFQKALQAFCLPYDSNSSLALKCAPY